MVSTKQEISTDDIEVLPEDIVKYDNCFKIIVIGNSGVGKSCLSINASKNMFDTAYQPTLGVEYFSFNVKICEKVINLQIWDTCGQEAYRSLITNYYRNASLVMIVYAINDLKSFEELDIWVRESKKHSNPDVKIFLIGNKADKDDERMVSTEEGNKFQGDYGLHYAIETSAKTGFNTQRVFKEAAKVIYEDYLNYEKFNGLKEGHSLDICKVSDDQKAKGCCK